jgi:hypothetical protein
MIRFALILLLCLAACAPAVVLNAPMTTENFIEDLNSYSNPVWEASRRDAEAAVLEAMRAFDPGLNAFIVVIKDTGLIVVEARSSQLERQNVLVLLAFQDQNTVLGVYDLKNNNGSFDPQALAVRLEVAIVAAMDAKFQRGKLL